MKPTVKILACFLFGFIAITYTTTSCRKENVTKPNQPPIANAGTDQTIFLPTNTVTLDGSVSSDPDNNITSYSWTKVSGPASFNITVKNPNKKEQALVTNLVEGVYQFELKVTDAEGLFAKDTVEVTIIVQSSSSPTIEINGNIVIFNHLLWHYDPTNKLVLTQTLFLPNGYSVNNIKNVYLYDEVWPIVFGVPPFWELIEKEDGTTTDKTYYKSNNNNGVIAYHYWYSASSPSYWDLALLPAKMKIEFF